MSTNILHRNVSPAELAQSGDFLALTLSHPEQLQPFSFVLADGTVAEVWDTGVICLTPVICGNTDAVLSCGVHGNETAPIELCAAICQDVLTGKLQLRQRTLFLFGNPPAINAGKRELQDNLNRLFSGHHSKGEAEPGWERQRAAKLEQYVQRFYEEGGEGRERLLYDLHTAIRGSQFEKFAVYPFLHGKPWSRSQLQFLLACGVDTFLLMQTPASTFSYFGAQSCGAQAFTLELGKVRAFGDNDMSRFATCDSMLRALVTDTVPALAEFDESRFNFFVVSRAVNKQTEQFELCFARNIENFTQFPLGTLLARDGDTEYRVDEPGEAIIFPNADVAIGQRAMLLVKPVSIAGQLCD
ncbi:MAG: succinylglutamate desuccinylase [Rheinheimera sp.]|nr:succinylglutamate desuccinylase [Rheinheimera sp.]